jgi:hypothetical protein
VGIALSALSVSCRTSLRMRYSATWKALRPSSFREAICFGFGCLPCPSALQMHSLTTLHDARYNRASFAPGVFRSLAVAVAVRHYLSFEHRVAIVRNRW